MTTEQRLYIDMLPKASEHPLTIDREALQWMPESYRESARRWIGRARVDPGNATEYVTIARAMNHAYLAERQAEKEATEEPIQ